MMCSSRTAFVVFAASFAIRASSSPTVTELAFVQDPATHVATVSFTLGESAVVTLDVQTNGVTIGWRNFREGISGCAIGKVNPAGDYVLTWNPTETWHDAPSRIPTGTVAAVVTAWSPGNTPDFMDVDLTSTSNVTYYVSEDDLPCAVTDEMYKTTHLLMKRLHCANERWTMGSPETEKGRAGIERKWEEQREVVFSQDYYIGLFETTQGQWKRMTGQSLPAAVTVPGDTFPMCCRTYNNLRGSWVQADTWPKKNHYVTDASDIGKGRILTGVAFDLPTEAQWEFACRGGTHTAFNTGTDGDANGFLSSEVLSRTARWLGNSVSGDGSATNFTAVGSYEPNGYGLYDTIGSVSEFCLDFRATGTTDSTAYDTVDPVGGEAEASAGNSKVFARGSCYLTSNKSEWDGIYQADTIKHRSAYRGNHYIAPNTANRLDIGFRLVAPVGAWAPLNSEVTATPSQSIGSRVVKFKYDLESDAIVTLKVLVDGEPVDGAASCVGGDVNRLVSVGAGKMISWYPDRSLEGLDVESGRVSLKIEKWSVSDPPAYMALDLTNAAKTNIAYYSEGELPGGATNELFKTDWLLMRRVPAKDVVWWMGVATNATGKSVETNGDRPAEQRHLVKLSEDYFMGVFPITERQLQLVNGTASTGEGNLMKPALLTHHAVRNRSGGLWPADGHAVASTGLLGILRTRSGGYQFDLPTEAHWEFACRAASGSAFCDGNAIGAANNGNTLANMTDFGWVEDNSGSVLHVVGMKDANAFGLYDMHGNIWEWCLDYWDAARPFGLSGAELAAAQTTPVVDPQGASGKAWSDSIVLRGGSASQSVTKARSGDRTGYGYCATIYTTGGSVGSGVRVVCPIAQEE